MTNILPDWIETFIAYTWSPDPNQYEEEDITLDHAIIIEILKDIKTKGFLSPLYPIDNKPIENILKRSQAPLQKETPFVEANVSYFGPYVGGSSSGIGARERFHGSLSTSSCDTDTPGCGMGCTFFQAQMEQFNQCIFGADAIKGKGGTGPDPGPMGTGSQSGEAVAGSGAPLPDNSMPFCLDMFVGEPPSGSNCPADCPMGDTTCCPQGGDDESSGGEIGGLIGGNYLYFGPDQGGKRLVVNCALAQCPAGQDCICGGDILNINSDEMMHQTKPMDNVMQETPAQQ